MKKKKVKTKIVKKLNSEPKPRGPTRVQMMVRLLNVERMLEDVVELLRDSIGGQRIESCRSCRRLMLEEVVKSQVEKLDVDYY